jgi:hypothetical protein
MTNTMIAAAVGGILMGLTGYAGSDPPANARAQTACVS